MELGQSAVGAIYLGGTQILPTGTDNAYTHTLTNVKIVYSSGTYLKPDGTNYAYFTGTYTLKKGSTTISTSTVTLYPKFSSQYLVRGSNPNYLYWNRDSYGQTPVIQTTLSVSLNYGDLTSSSSVIIGANTKSITNGEVYPYISGYANPVFGNGSYTIGYSVECRITRRWTSGLGGDINEEITDISKFNWTSSADWVTFNETGKYVQISSNKTGVQRTTNYHVVLKEDSNIIATKTITQNA